MQRSRLKNIINKSKEISSNKQEIVGESPFDEFKKSLPIEVGDNYRLEAAWKAYGSPKNYQEALWQGLIQPIDENTFKLPSIGYNEETDEYEYLNKGEDNETVNRDIRVWDNDIIPLVQELKLGGYVRTFNEEKDCWTYTKNSQKREQPVEDKGEQVIEQFKEGGKSSSQEGEKPRRNMEQLVTYANNQKPPFIQRILNNDERTIPLIMEDGKKHHGTHMLAYGEKDGKTYVFPEIQDFDGDLIRINWPANLDTAIEKGDYLEMTPEEAEEFTKNYKKYYPNYKPFQEDFKPQSFKQGGQMNVIPEGALHARKNNMELAKEGEITHKGIPVVDNDGNQQAEVEKEEWTMTKELTEDVENWYKEYYKEDISQKDKDELAIKCGKRIVKELLHNTDDRANLIARMLEEEEE